MFFYEVEGHMQKLSSFGRGKKIWPKKVTSASVNNGGYLPQLPMVIRGINNCFVYIFLPSLLDFNTVFVAHTLDECNTCMVSHLHFVFWHLFSLQNAMLHKLL